jgi:hypothetical protein
MNAAADETSLQASNLKADLRLSRLREGHYAAAVCIGAPLVEPAWRNHIGSPDERAATSIALPHPDATSGRGPIWGDATEELNVTLLAWPAGEGPAAHVNDERDVVTRRRGAGSAAYPEALPAGGSVALTGSSCGSSPSAAS